MYIPLLNTLEKILRAPELSNYFKMQVNLNGIIEKFSDSEAFKTNTLFSEFPNSIQLQLFYDDFETVNPLG